MSSSKCSTGEINLYGGQSDSIYLSDFIPFKILEWATEKFNDGSQPLCRFKAALCL